MALKYNKAFSLLEVIITVAILSTAIVFIFRAFTAVLSNVKFSQNITLACFLAEDKLWELERIVKDNLPLPADNSGREKIEGRDFNWNYKIIESDDPDLKNLKELEFNVSWQENIKREAKYSIATYLMPKRQ